MRMDIFVKDIRKNMIKPSDNSGQNSVVYSMTKRDLKSDTRLSSFIPPKCSKMTPRLRQICRCDICIITKDMHIDLDRFRTNIVTHLQKKRNLVDTYKKVHILPQGLHITSRNCFQMVYVYIPPSRIQLSPSHVILLNQRVLFIWSVVFLFLMNVPCTLFLTNNLIMEQILHLFISVFIPIN